MINNTKRKITALLAILLLMFYVVYPSFSLAQEVTETPTPTPDNSQTTNIDSSATLGNSTDNSSNTGDNSINPTDTPTSTPTPTDTLTPTPTPTDVPTNINPAADSTDSAQVENPDASQSADVNITNTGDITNNDSNTANTGANSSTGQGPQGNDHSSSVIDTGGATSVADVNNSLNTAIINSNLFIQTVNIYLAQDSDINLTDPITVAVQEIANHPDDSTVNVSFTNINNFAYLTNDIFNSANTGGNTINSDGSAKIDTGDAFALVSSINRVNLVEINSVVHLVSINIFGNLNGNIILPDFNSVSSCSTCGVSLNINNSATVTNNVSSTANTGQNTLDANSGNISTGDATSATNVLNLVNTNILSANDALLYINVFGSWNGSFIGWGNFSPQDGGSSLVFSSTSAGQTGAGTDCGCVGDLNINNNAIVVNNVTSLANTGGNTINANRGNIQTGNAFSLVSVFNLVNTNFINSFGFFGFINIFGNWHGNIGGAKEFAALNSGSQNDSSKDSQTNSDSNSVKEQGGQLSVTSNNNVGAYVFPGDTVTFFIKVKNTGKGKVYGTKLDLFLIRNGKSAGGTTFDLGDIDAGKGKTLTTGFVLSKSAPGGVYTAEADVYGTVGPDDSGVNATSQNSFKVFGNSVIVSAAHSNTKTNTVLGAKISVNDKAGVLKAAQELLYLSLLAMVIMAYVSIRLIRRKELVYAIYNSSSFKEAIHSLRMFLL